MKKYLSVICLLTIVYTLWAQNNVITYTASEKLEVTTDFRSNGLYVNAFDVAITSHDFSGTTGIITFSNSVTSIGNYAFYGCSSLTSITIPSSVTSIGDFAFRDCSSLTSIDIPNSVMSIGSSAFSGCSGLTSIMIPNSVTSIGDYAFEGCSGLTSIVVESGNLKYDSRNNCNAIIETATNTLIVGCMNTSIPNSVMSIGELAFSGCSGLTSIDIPNSVTSIVEWAFSGCSGLTSIDIPNSVTSIGGYAFHGCSGLTSITCHAEVPPFCGGNVFEDVTRTIPLYVPASSIPFYQAAEQWNEFDIRPLLVEIDSITPDSANLSWLPVDSAAQYQLRIYSDQVALDTTIIISADPDNGGIMSQTTSTPRRQPRIVLDEISSTVVISIDPNSGASPDQPFVVTVSTTSENKVDIHYDMQVFGATGGTLRQENGLFTLNEEAPFYEALGDVHSSSLTSDSFCYDLYGHRYPLSVWPSLPAGIYILHEGGVTTKIMKH